MKTVVTILLLALAMAGCSKPQQYWCPMHPEVISADPNAQCDKCGGMKLLPKETPPPPAPSTKAGKFHCPMHPTVVSDKKGSCSICGMDLVPIAQSRAGQADHESKVPGRATVAITPETRQRMGLTLGTIAKRGLVREIRAPARIVADETKLYHVNVKVDGWVEQLFVATTGQFVRKGDPLLTIYSPSLMSAQAEHLSATDEMRPLARRRLELMDMTDEQIARLERTKQINKTLTLYAPASGYVIERNIATGHKLSAGEMLLVLADLSNVWADADVFQSDVALVTIGAAVAVAVDDQTFTGKVNFIAPTVDATTRTIKVRMQVPNPDTKLKPEMWAIARLKIDLGERLAISSSAVMRTGERAYAFKDIGDAHLAPVEIALGARAGDWFVVRDGLKEGDKVVTSANFLVDSESSLKAALAAMSGDGSHAH
jgi:Cu(I)/Ag(I) efflux system membrane fusion protein